MSYKKDYVSFSALKQFSISPNHYIEYVTGKAPDTDAFRFGRAVHAYILEPDVFKKEFAVAPDVDRRYKAGKQAYKEFCDTHVGKQVVTAKQYQRIQSIAYQINELRPARELLENTKRETRIRKQYRGVTCVGVIDAHTDSYALDLKTTRFANAGAMHNTIYKYSYHVQAYLYTQLAEVDRFYWIAAEKESPFEIGVYLASDETLDFGKKLLDEWIDAYKEWDGMPLSYSNDEDTIVYDG